MWNVKNISNAGKITLLKTAAQSMPNFWMSLMMLPMDISDAIEKKMNMYRWGGKRITKVLDGCLERRCV